MNTTDMTWTRFPTRGFTLIELAIVILILGLLLGSLIIPLQAKIEIQRRETTTTSLEAVREALLGFAVINRRLPCPDTNGDGLEDAGACNQEGQIPWSTLGIERFDAWGRVFRYRVENNYTTAPIQDPPDTASNLVVRDRNNTALTGSNPDAVAAIIFSCGGDGRPNADNDANGAPNNDANCSNPGTANAYYTQDVFVADQFDDLVIWISKNTLLNRLVSAGKWP